MDTEIKLAESLGIKFEIRKVKIGRYKINYLICGSGKPLLLIHGGNIGWGQWYPNISEFAKYFRVYAIDLPGGGRSSVVDYPNINLENDLVETVEKFMKSEIKGKTSVLASSIGGWITLRLALRNQVKLDKLVLVDSLGFTNHMGLSDRIIGIYPLAKFLSKTVLKPVSSNPRIEDFLRSVFYNKRFLLRKEFVDYFYETMSRSHNILFISRLSSVRGVRKEFILRDNLEKVKNKVLVLWGEKDKMMPLDKNTPDIKRLPNLEFVVLKDAGHIPSIEKSGEFNRVVSNFLRVK